jgi:proline iminopeptidase
MQSSYVERVPVNGLEIYARHCGEGPTVVVLHGGPGADFSSLLPQFDALSGTRRLVYYDQRGGGRSPAPPGARLDWRQHVADLTCLLDHWRIQFAHLLGYSWGGLLALLFTTAHRNRVASLALVSPAPATARGRELFIKRFAERMGDRWIVEQRAELEASGLRRSDPTAYRQRAFELSVAPYYRRPELARGAKRFLVAARAREAVWRGLGNYDITHELRGLCVPALVMHGRHDPIPLVTAQRTAELLDARFEIMDNSGHLPFIEEFDRFVTLLDDFFPSTLA